LKSTSSSIDIVSHPSAVVIVFDPQRKARPSNTGSAGVSAAIQVRTRASAFSAVSVIFPLKIMHA
jgi:pantoate kinase